MKSYDRIKNFSTSIQAEKTIAEIEMMLAKAGAMKIMKEFDPKGRPFRLAFSIMTKAGEMPIKLPIDINGIKNVFKKQVSNGKLPRKFWGTPFAEEQSMRVGWRIILDWLDSQLTLLSIEMVKVEEIFLPYMWDGKTEQTMFQMLEKRGFTVGEIEYKGDEHAANNTGEIKA